MRGAHRYLSGSRYFKSRDEIGTGTREVSICDRTWDAASFSLRADGTQPEAALTGKKGIRNMPLLQVVIVLIVVGVLLWMVDRFIPMASSIKSILNAVVTIAVVLWLLNIFGLLHSLASIHIGKP